MIVDRKTKSLLYAFLFLALVEGGLRLSVSLRPAARLTSERPVVLLLGTSRSLRGLRPTVIERALRRHGFDEPWVANLARIQLTTVGLYRLYMEQIHPLVEKGHEPGGVVAVEVRGSGMNDNFVTPAEADYLEQIRAAPGDDFGADMATISFREHLLAGRLGAASRSVLGNLYLAHAHQTLRPALLALFVPRTESKLGADPILAFTEKTWAHGERGWQPFRIPQPPGLRRAMWEPHYRDKLLKDFSMGGTQTMFLRRLVRQIREDGFRPVLYVMPITDIHRGFYRPGDYDDFRRHLTRLARTEGVPLIDIDHRLKLPLSDYFDTHHINSDAVDDLSERFAEWAVLPELPVP